MRMLFLIVAAVFSIMSAEAKMVTVSVSDVPLDVLKRIVPNDKTIGLDLAGVPDDVLQTMLQKRGTLTVDDSVLPTDLRTRLEAQRRIGEVTSSLAVGREWADMGRAIGIATREGLSAITDETAKFSKTMPGKFTMVMIAWKVMGADFLKATKGLFIGVPLLTFWACMFVWWLKRVYSPHKRKVYATDGKSHYEEVDALSVQWAKADPKGEAGWAILAAVKSAAFVIVMFIIVWGVM